MDMMTAGTVIIRSKKPSVFPAVFLLKMLKWIIIRSKKKWREFLKKSIPSFETLIPKNDPRRIQRIH